MPNYVWRDKKTHAKVEVFRPFAEYEVPPTAEELEAAGLDLEAEYERLVGVGIKVTWAAGWGNGPNGSGKGHWGK